MGITPAPVLFLSQYPRFAVIAAAGPLFWFYVARTRWNRRIRLVQNFHAGKRQLQEAVFQPVHHQLNQSSRLSCPEIS